MGKSGQAVKGFVMSNATKPVPIVLVHGIFGFDQLTLGGAKLADYFRGIPEALRSAGHVVPPPPRLNPAAKVKDRAQDLKRYLDDPTNSDIAGQPVHLIAHSMGGLDARCMISHLGMAERVLTLTTIDTPHHGSPVADQVVAGTHPALLPFLQHLGVDLTGINDLTTAACAELNSAAPEVDPVSYFSVVGHFTPPHVLGVPLGILGVSHDLIQATEGDNDGLVSVTSATFGQLREKWTLLETWEGNHFRVINWGTDLIPNPLELADDTIVERYLSIASRITRG
jgi:triacylglycerol lipase